MEKKRRISQNKSVGFETRTSPFRYFLENSKLKKSLEVNEKRPNDLNRAQAKYRIYFLLFIRRHLSLGVKIYQVKTAATDPLFLCI